MNMDGIGVLINGVLGDLTGELLLVIPAALVVTGTLWGAPKAIGFFKRIAK